MNTLEVNFTEFNDGQCRDNGGSDVILRKLESFVSDVSTHGQFASHNKGNQYFAGAGGPLKPRKQQSDSSSSSENDFGVTFVT